MRQIEALGLTLEAGGIDAGILIDLLDPAEQTLDIINLDEVLAEAKAKGMTTIKLIMSEQTIAVVPTGPLEPKS